MKLALLCLAASFLLLADVPLERDNTSPSAVQVDEYLAKKGSPLAGTGTVLDQLTREFELDPAIIVAISGAETGFGKHVCADNNAWNWFYQGPCPESKFASYDEGLQHVAKFLRRSYLNKGYTTVELIRAKYCTAGCDDWIPLVSRFQLEIPRTVIIPPAIVPPASPLKVTGPVGSTPSAPVRSAAARSGIFGIPRWLIFLAGAAALIGLTPRLMKRT